MNAMFTPVNRNLSEHNICTFDEKHLYPVVAPQRLLLAPIRVGIIHEIRKSVSNIPQEYFDVLYKELIDKFTAFVQILPVTNESKLTSLLDESLMRAFFALQLYQKDSHEYQDYLMPYVVFSANLLMDIACVTKDRNVILSEADGSFISVWNPYNDGHMKIGSYYRIRSGGGLSPWSAKRSTICLACNIMPETGFDWIYKNSHALDMWLALLADDKEGAGLLRLYFDRANDMMLDLKNNPEFIVPLNIEIEESIDLNNANEFLQWLKNELENNSLAIDKQNGDIYNIEGDNLLVTNHLLQKYLAQKNKYRTNIDLATLTETLIKVGFIKSTQQRYTYAQTNHNNVNFHGFLHSSTKNEHITHNEKISTEQTDPRLNNVNKDEKTTSSSETKIEQIMASGGVIHGYVINVTHGLIIPTTTNPVQIESIDKSVILNNQLPQLPEQTNSSNSNTNKATENNTVQQKNVGTMF